MRGYGYGSWSGGNPAGTMNWIASPRWMGSSGADGEYLQIGSTFSGSDNAHSSLSQIDHVGYIDPNPPDTTNTPIQASPVTNSVSAPFLSEYYALGTIGSAATPTFRDADGHAENWVTDAAGRTTQAQLCTETVNQQCSVTPLVTGQRWDPDNNLLADIDARGYETDYAYDFNGNTIAVGAPSTTTSAGTFRPTKLFDYDQFNNVVAYCDEVATHAANADFTTAPTATDSLCTSRAGSVPHARSAYVYPSYQPYGELASMMSPLGYTQRLSYSPAGQGGTDYGLATDVSGDPIAQTDATTYQEHKTFGYDVHGNLVTYGTGAGAWSLAYDARNRMTSATDPDNVTTNTCYNPDESVRAKQTALQYKLDGTVCGPSSSTQEYDLDGNQTAQTHHYGNGVGRVQKWYDGAGRLVEVAQPREPDAASALGPDYALPRARQLDVRLDDPLLVRYRDPQLRVRIGRASPWRTVRPPGIHLSERRVGSRLADAVPVPVRRCRPGHRRNGSRRGLQHPRRQLVEVERLRRRRPARFEDHARHRGDIRAPAHGLRRTRSARERVVRRRHRRARIDPRQILHVRPCGPRYSGRFERRRQHVRQHVLCLRRRWQPTEPHRSRCIVRRCAQHDQLYVVPQRQAARARCNGAVGRRLHAVRPLHVLVPVGWASPDQADQSAVGARRAGRQRPVCLGLLGRRAPDREGRSVRRGADPGRPKHGNSAGEQRGPSRPGRSCSPSRSRRWSRRSRNPKPIP